jgi:hypothetical protein
LNWWIIKVIKFCTHFTLIVKLITNYTNVNQWNERTRMLICSQMIYDKNDTDLLGKILSVFELNDFKIYFIQHNVYPIQILNVWRRRVWMRYFRKSVPSLCFETVTLKLMLKGDRFSSWQWYCTLFVDLKSSLRRRR